MTDKERNLRSNEDRGVKKVIKLMFSGFVMEHYEGAAEKPKEQTVTVFVASPEPSATETTDILSTLSGPRIYALPNAPTGWNESTHEVLLNFIRKSFDPGRPESLLGDGQGLGTDEELDR